MCQTAVKTIHPFEVAGLGIAPFEFKGLEEKVFVACPGAEPRPGGTCAYCCQSIRYCCHIESHDGKRFMVGCDCVRKLDRADNTLLNAVEKAKAQIEADKREAKRQAAWEARQAKRNAELDVERERNGGLTDYEVRQQAAEADRLARLKEANETNGWLLKVLENVGYGSDFIDSMIERLERVPARELSDRQLDILRDLYAKTHGRRGSKKYEAAADQFDVLAKPGINGTT